MSATILVQSGISAGTSYWIDRPVLRIGSDPQCEICLPTADLAPHALTLEFRDGAYRTYNRGSESLSVGGALLQPGANTVWRADQTAQLPGDTRLVLQIDGDPRPSPRPDARIDDDYPVDDPAALLAGADTAEAAAKKSSNSLVQMGIIGLCALGTVAFLMMGGGEETIAQNRPTFEAIVTDSLAKDKDDPARLILPRLQYAQAALVRGHNDLARARFLKLRDQLVRQIESLPDDKRAGPDEMLDYVEYRLSQL